MTEQLIIKALPSTTDDSTWREGASNSWFRGPPTVTGVFQS